MKWVECAILASSVLVAIPAVRAGVRILNARVKENLAKTKEAALGQLSGQKRQTETLEVERLKNEANDLIEYSSLIPSWAIWCALLGILINIIARAHPVFSQTLTDAAILNLPHSF